VTQKANMLRRDQTKLNIWLDACPSFFIHNISKTAALALSNNIFLPMINFTFQDLLDFTKMEEETVKEIAFPEGDLRGNEPSERSVKNLIAYSKALSIRKSRSIQNIAVVLN
jgi:hypothetical protein